MIKLTLIPLVLFGSLALAAPGTAQKLLLNDLISPEEPKIKDAVWMTDKNLYIGVIDDGSNRSGLADYVCSIATEKGAPAELVKVVDIVKVKRDGKFHELGKSYCR